MNDPADEWHDNGPVKVREVDSAAYQVLKRWEKLRLRYNAILIPWTVLMVVMFGRMVADSEILFDVVVGGVIANVFFCLGPVLETYLVWFGASPQGARHWLFGLGTAFTGLAAAVAVVA